MNLDIRYPLGWIFVAFGVVLGLYGLETIHNGMYAASMNLNLNLIWGVVMLGFGASMLFLARRAS